jgi:glutamate--cysteine ligase
MSGSGLTPALTLASARDRIRDQCFRPGDTGLVGLELEWHVYDRGDLRRVVPLPALMELADELGPLPNGSVITFEPGGQLELSAPPFAGVDTACDALAGDHDVVAAALAPLGFCLVATGVDHATECDRRWRLAHRIGPALSAAFATSPVAEGEPTGWASTRLATWLDIDPSRTAAAPGGPEEWVSYALDANVLLMRRGGEMVPLRERLPFSAWIRDGHPLGAPTADDLDYHLTTLFPPVRPRGFLEIRYLDALPNPWWRVAVAVTTALLQNRDAGERASDACAAVADEWCEAARFGISRPAVRDAALATVGAARDAFDRLAVPISAATTEICDRYIERYLDRCRTPGDDVLDAWRRGEPLVALPPEEDRWT